jgi:hypothetical protein
MLPLSLLRDYVIYRRLQVLHILMVFLSIYIYIYILQALVVLITSTLTFVNKMQQLVILLYAHFVTRRTRDSNISVGFLLNF